jgi:uncharacterized protein YjbI with pentapeptide repeats
MAESASFEELEQQIEAVLKAETTDFFELAKILGLDPKQDFVGADLSGVDLSGKDLSYANFTGTTLRGADLSHTNLEGANFTDADLSSRLLLAITSAFQTANSLHHLSNLAHNIAHDIALVHDIALDFAVDLALVHDHDHDLALDLALAHDLARTLDLAHDIARARARARTLALDIARARARARAFALDHDFALDFVRNNIVATLNHLQCQHLGTTFRNANLQSVCWNGAHLEGALMIDCQGLTPEDATGLKARGVIFDDAPGERSPVNSPRLPLPV